MKISIMKPLATVLLACLMASCAVPQDQFGYAVKTGNLTMARSTVRPNFANMRVYENPTQYSVPMQYAILQNDPRMADFLLEEGAHRSLDGKNLAYYSALNGHPAMARFFISRGIGRNGDIALAANERAASQRRQREQSQMAGLIGLGILAAVLSSSPGSGGGDDMQDNPGQYNKLNKDGTWADDTW